MIKITAKLTYLLKKHKLTIKNKAKTITKLKKKELKPQKAVYIKDKNKCFYIKILIPICNQGNAN